MDWKLEVVTVPVSDMDWAKAFYTEKAGFVVDLDTRIGNGARLLQLTPPGSTCSIHLNSGIVDAMPGRVRGLHLVVSGVEAARRTRGTRDGCQRGLALRVGQVGGGSESRAPRLCLLRLLQRP